MTQIIITIVLVGAATFYALYKLFRSIVPGKKTVKKDCGVGCAHCMQ